LSLEIKFESIRESWQDFERLALQEQAEISEQRPFRPDWESMQALNEKGIFQVLVARIDGNVVGYFTWLLDFDLESKGTLIANQLAWYVEPGHPIIAVRMLDRAIEELKKIGCEFVYFHHTVHGRGASLGRLFERKGAELLGYNYVLKLKGE
jgi:hypothetical protein